MDKRAQLKAELNFLRYGTVRPSALQVIKSMPGRLVSFLKKDSFIPSSYSWMGFGSAVTEQNKANFIKEGWNKSATVYSIVRKIAKTCAYAPWGAYRVKDEQGFKRYKAISVQQQNGTSLKQLQLLRHKALEPVNDQVLNDLMSNPNPTQGSAEYHEGLFTYKLLTGDAYEYGDIVTAGANGGKPSELWLLPPQYVGIVPTKTFPVLPMGYILNSGRPINFTPEEILHTKYFNPNYSISGNHLYGFSPLQAAWLTVQEDNDAKDAAIEMLQNRGVRGIVGMEGWVPDKMSANVVKEQAGLLKERWRQTQIENRGGIIPVSGKVGFAAVGLSISDLKILEISNYTQDDICNVYGVWSGLFNSNSNQKYDNVEQFRKDFIINTILPELNALRDARNRKLQTDWGYKGSGIVLDYDSTVYVELQDDMEKLAKWLSQAYWFTGNEKRIYMNESENDNPMMNEILVPQNLIPLNDLNISELPETGLNDE